MNSRGEVARLRAAQFNARANTRNAKTRIRTQLGSLILARVLEGSSCVGTSDMREPPKDVATGIRFDTTKDPHDVSCTLMSSAVSGSW